MGERLVIDPLARAVRVDGQPVQLRSREFDLLAFLVTNRGRWFRREDLLREVWGHSVGSAATVTVHIGRLRAKLEQSTGRGPFIWTQRTLGYAYEPVDLGPDSKVYVSLLTADPLPQYGRVRRPMEREIDAI